VIGLGSDCDRIDPRRTGSRGAARVRTAAGWDLTPGVAHAKAADMKALFASIDRGDLGSRVGTALMAALVLAAVACGSKPSADSTAKPSEPSQGGDKHEMGEQGEQGEMAALPPQIAKFHATLGPRWHAAQGPQRMADTCAAMAQFHTDADAIVAAAAPSGANAAAWSEGGKQLADAVTALDATCQAKDAAAFEPAFTRVHNSFHHVMEAGMHEGEHGEHKM
jgi:hypothetical protein